MTYLPDINVWLALISRRHEHNSRAVRWRASVSGSSIVFCRVTQMGVLRLLTNARVMGPDILTQRQAWNIYDQIMRDPKIGLLSEPMDVEETWRTHTQLDKPSNAVWTDAYLLAFAQEHHLSLVTFDKGLASIDDPAIISLS
jgi:uncharacterized protein